MSDGGDVVVGEVGQGPVDRRVAGGHYDAFVSYARAADAGFTGLLTEALTRRGFTVWRDVDYILGGDDWRARISKDILRARAFVFIVTRQSLESEICLEELRQAVQLNKKIIPVRRGDEQDDDLPSALERREWIFMREQDDAEAAIARLVEALETDVDWRDELTDLAERTRKWIDGDGDVLRGKDLEQAEDCVLRQAQHRQKLTADQADYIRRSIDARKVARRVRRTAVAVALIAVTGAAIVAWIQRQSAVHETHIVQSQLLAAKADYQLGTTHSKRLASILALGAYAIQATPQALSAMLDVAGTREVGPPLQDVQIINGVAYAPKQPVVAAATQSGIDLWSTSRRGLRFDFNRSLLGDYGLVGTHGSDSAVAATAVAFSPDGRLIAASGADGSVQLFDAGEVLSRNRRMQIVLRASSGRMTSIAWSAAGDVLAAGAADGTVHVWRVGTLRSLVAAAKGRRGPFDVQQPGEVTQSQTGSVNTIAFEGGTTILAAGGDRGLNLIATTARRVVHVLARRQMAVSAIAFSPDGRTLVSGGPDGQIRIWNAASGSIVKRLPRISAAVTSLGFVAGQAVVSGSTDAAVRTWDTTTGEETDNTPLSAAAPAVALAVAPDRRTFAVATSNQQIDFWAASDPRQLQPPRELAGPLSLTALSQDGSTLAVLRPTGAVQVWRTGGRSPAQTIRTGQARVDAIALNARGTVLAVANEGGGISLWKVPGRANAEVLPTANVAITALSFSPDGKLIAAGVGTAVQTWRVDTGAPDGRPLMGLIEPVTSVGFSADGRVLAAAGDDVALWRLPSRQELRLPLPIPGGVGGGTVVFSPKDPGLLAVGSGAGSQLWDVQTERSLSALLPDEPPMAFTRDGAILASAIGHGVQLWDVATVTRLGPIVPTGSPPALLGFDRLGRLLSLTSSGTVNVWGVTPSLLIPRLCASAQPPPTASEWHEVALGVPFGNPCHT